MAARTCGQCGTALTENQRFCVNCGAPVPEAGSAPRPEEQPTPPASWTPLPPAPEPTPLPPTEPAAAAPGVPWTAWLGVGGCGLLAIATGLDWFAGAKVNGFDIPMAALWSDTATGTLPIAAPFLLIAAVGLAVAMIKPASGPLGTTFLVAGAVSVLLAAWYVIRVLSTAQGVPILDVLSIGVWVLIVASFAVVGAGVALLLRKPSG